MLFSLVSLAAAKPVIVQDAGHYMMHIFAPYPIDRSDQESVATSGGSGYGGGYGDFSSGHGGGGGFDGGAGGHLESSGGQFDGGHQDFSSIGGGHGGGFDGGYGGDDGGHGGHGISLDGGHNHVHSVPVSEHIEVTKPVAVPVYKHVGNVSSYCLFLDRSMLHKKSEVATQWISCFFVNDRGK